MNREALERYVRKGYAELEGRLEKEEEDKGDNDEGKGSVNQRHISMTDPDAAVIRQRGAVKPKPRYKTHRAVDGAHEVITATEMTAGGVDEGHRLTSLIESHQKNTGRGVETVVADSKYGTIDNYLACHDRGIQAHIPDLKKSQDKGERRQGIFPAERFHYDEATDAYLCPAGESLKRRSLHKQRDAVYYAAPKKVCDGCALRAQCTTSKTVREIKRHFRQEDLDAMRSTAASWISRRDIRIRQHLMERSFGLATRYGLKRMRWRRLWRARIQDYLIATIQNMRILITHKRKPLGMAGIRLPDWNFLHIIFNPMQFCF